MSDTDGLTCPSRQESKDFKLTLKTQQGIRSSQDSSQILCGRKAAVLSLSRGLHLFQFIEKLRMINYYKFSLDPLFYAFYPTTKGRAKARQPDGRRVLPPAGRAGGETRCINLPGCCSERIRNGAMHSSAPPDAPRTDNTFVGWRRSQASAFVFNAYDPKATGL
ncbi:hypothetical protein EVAR_32756_1 [Eumeta japonica]|uniref:Uncharacterized protein n=1 Tax=Eumeta variegata TaxID=151549 RepID=A0A4C1XM98_EUMVA|nr:hypothetical protein EVAR_32756_1 [Eumeta japonica]